MLCRIDKLQTDDIENAKALLKESDLPADDISEHAETFLTAKVNNELVGAVGLEIWNDCALLRSFVVKEKYRNNGLGRELYEKCIELAQRSNIKLVALLTTTAELYFSKKGFIKVTGDSIPFFVKQTKEFQVYCPKSSAVMIKKVQ